MVLCQTEPAGTMTERKPRFEAVYREQSPLVYNFLLRQLGNREDAEDATVETFRRVHRGLKAFRGGRAGPATTQAAGDAPQPASEHRTAGAQRADPLRAWTLKIAQNVAKRALSDRRRNQTVPLEGLRDSGGGLRQRAPAEDPEKTILDKETAEAILAQLPDKQRAAVWMRVALEMTDEEVAEALEVPLGTVKTWVWRSLTRLRKACKGGPA